MISKEQAPQLNRAARRRKKKNRQATKKGYTKVIYMDEDKLPKASYVPAGGKIHQEAMKNSKAFRKGARGQ
jgi:hypothetical protein